jgi:alkylation response protein AidB-like acyl-CoA dehydrogenase
MYAGLSQGAMHTIETHGTDEQKQQYLPALISGRWTGTMCLTEAQAGSDLGLLRTRAEPLADGSYQITGTKIFISSGDHDLAENIIHIVLARLPDAPSGTKGISLFVVPKLLIQDDGLPVVANGVSCTSLEAKMGIHGNATCVLQFEGARGWLLGEVNKGLNHMFTFMNLARIGSGLQGLAHAELGYQISNLYTRERLQMRSLSGVKNTTGVADPIIVHPDIRRMLLTLLRPGVQVVGTYIRTRMQARGAILGLLRRTAWLQLSGCASTLPCATPRAVVSLQWGCCGCSASGPRRREAPGFTIATIIGRRNSLLSRCALCSMCTGRA